MLNQEMRKEKLQEMGLNHEIYSMGVHGSHRSSWGQYSFTCWGSLQPLEEML